MILAVNNPKMKWGLAQVSPFSGGFPWPLGVPMSLYGANTAFPPGNTDHTSLSLSPILTNSGPAQRSTQGTPKEAQNVDSSGW